MLNYQSTPVPPPSSMTPAVMTVFDMVNTHIEYVRYRPYDRPAILETGMVTQIKQHKNTLYLYVQPDTSGRTPKWVSEFDFIAYVH